jgi:hypothetical protein
LIYRSADVAARTSYSVGVVGVDDVVDEAPDEGFGVGHVGMGSWAAAVVVVWWVARAAAVA